MFADHYTQFVLVDLPKAKDEALISLNKFVLSVATPWKLRQYKAKAFFQSSVKIYSLDMGILQDKIKQGVPQRNGLAERCNRTQLERARCLLIDPGVLKMMWGAAILHAARIKHLVLKWGEQKPPAKLIRVSKPRLSVSSFLFLVAPYSRLRGTETSANMKPRYWKESLGFTLKDTTDTWCA